MECRAQTGQGAEEVGYSLQDKLLEICPHFEELDAVLHELPNTLPPVSFDGGLSTNQYNGKDILEVDGVLDFSKKAGNMNRFSIMSDIRFRSSLSGHITTFGSSAKMAIWALLICSAAVPAPIPK